MRRRCARITAEILSCAPIENSDRERTTSTALSSLGNSAQIVAVRAVSLRYYPFELIRARDHTIMNVTSKIAAIVMTTAVLAGTVTPARASGQLPIFKACLAKAEKAVDQKAARDQCLRHTVGLATPGRLLSSIADVRLTRQFAIVLFQALRGVAENRTLSGFRFLFACAPATCGSGRETGLFEFP